MTKVTDLEVGMGADYITPSMYWDGKVIESDYLFVSADKEPAVVAIDWRTNTVAKGELTRDIIAAPQGDGREAQTQIGG